MVQFAGKYKQTKEDKYKDFLAKLGVGMVMRQAAAASTPITEITDLGGGKWKIATSTKLAKVEIEFEPGKGFDEKTTDGREVTTTVTIEGNKWTTTQKVRHVKAFSVLM